MQDKQPAKLCTYMYSAQIYLTLPQYPEVLICKPIFIRILRLFGAGPPRGWEGPRANTKCGAHNIDCGRGSGGTALGNFELLRALKCVLGASEAPFLCMHTVHTYLQVGVFVQLQIKKYDVRGPS